ncbi:hypothetical protein [Aeromonas hydrophila]|uniref:hypothetical protein n=1 Tax=Aeromonas hydrophila TaxID=644 RepID=UPI003019B651
MRYQHEAHSSYLLMSRTLAQSLPGQHKLNILFSDCDHAGTQALWIVPCDENPIQGRLFGELNVTPQQIAKIHEIMDFMVLMAVLPRIRWLPIWLHYRY